MRYKNLTLLGLAFLWLTGWGHWGPRVKIGLSLDHSRGRETLLRKTREAMEDNRADLILKDAGDDSANQETQVQEMLKEGIQALVVIPCDPAKAAPLVEAAHQAGIKVISLESLIPNSGLDYLIGFNPVKAGELQAQALVRRSSQGRYLLIEATPPTPFTKGFREGQLNVLQPLIDKDEIHLVTKTDLLKADGVLAGDSKTAQGAVQSLEKAGRAGKVFLAGQGDDRETCARILSRTQTLTLYHPPQKLAEETAYLAAKLARKAHEFDCQFVEMENGPTQTQAVLMTPLVVDAKNLDSTILPDKGWKREDLSNK